MTDLRDPAPARRLAARWSVGVTLVVESPLSIGSGEAGPGDAPVLRTADDHLPLLPGTTLAGVLRAFAATDALAGALFGGDRGDDRGAQSLLTVHDAVAAGAAPTGRRDGVAIAPATGTAESHKLFEREVVLPGTAFPALFELDVPVHQAAAERGLVALLAAALDGLDRGEVRLGARTNRGLGRLRPRDWHATRHDLASPAGCLAWLTADPDAPRPPFPTAVEALRAVDPDLEVPSLAVEYARLRARAMIAGSVLVRSAPARADEPDVVQLTENGQPVLPATSLAGVLRARCLRIARLARGDAGEVMIADLFGPRLGGDQPRADLRASRVRVDDAVVQSGSQATVHRVAIDRFAQKVVDGALFDERITVGGEVELAVGIDQPTRADVALVALGLRDLLTGAVAVGGTAAVGRGVLQGRATLTVPARLAGDGPTAIELDPAAPAPALDPYLEALWEEDHR